MPLYGYECNACGREFETLADLGAQLLAQRNGAASGRAQLSLKNDNAGRPFIEHQLEVMNFYVSLQCAIRIRADIRLIHPDEIVSQFPEATRSLREPLSVRARISSEGANEEIGVVPDLAFGLRFPDGSRRCFLVEIDRGTMPIARGDLRQTSFERKMRVYLSAYAARQHETQFGWKTYRVLTVTTDQARLNSIVDALRGLPASAGCPGGALFFFATRGPLQTSDPLAFSWLDGKGRETKLI